MGWGRKGEGKGGRKAKGKDNVIFTIFLLGQPRLTAVVSLIFLVVRGSHGSATPHAYYQGNERPNV